MNLKELIILILVVSTIVALSTFNGYRLGLKKAECSFKQKWNTECEKLEGFRYWRIVNDFDNVITFQCSIDKQK